MLEKLDLVAYQHGYVALEYDLGAMKCGVTAVGMTWNLTCLAGYQYGMAGSHFNLAGHPSYIAS